MENVVTENERLSNWSNLDVKALVAIDFSQQMYMAIEEFCRQKVRDLCEGSHYSCARMRRGAECILKVRASGQARVEMARANKR